jgi:hypothetical protein
MIIGRARSDKQSYFYGKVDVIASGHFERQESDLVSPAQEDLER